MSSILPISREDKNTRNFLNKNSINQDPDSFRLMMEQMTNNNLNQLFSGLQSDSSQQSFSGLDGLGFYSPSDPLTSLGDNQLFDPNFMIPPIGGLNQYKMNSTLSKLAKYTDVTETLRWLNVEVSYDDPKTGKPKKGLVKKMYIQNVPEPQALLDNGDKVDFSKIKEVLGSKNRKESTNV